MTRASSLLVGLASLLFLSTSVLAAGRGSVVSSLRHYNAEERALTGARGAVATARLIDHWAALTPIRAGLDRVQPVRLSEGERVALRHELATLFSQTVEADARGLVADRVRRADDRRRDEMVTIARWANAHLDFDLREILGVSLLGSPVASR
jgi:hypothetical protein